MYSTNLVLQKRRRKKIGKQGCGNSKRSVSGQRMGSKVRVLILIKAVVK